MEVKASSSSLQDYNFEVSRQGDGVELTSHVDQGLCLLTSFLVGVLWRIAPTEAI